MPVTNDISDNNPSKPALEPRKFDADTAMTDQHYASSTVAQAIGDPSSRKAPKTPRDDSGNPSEHQSTSVQCLGHHSGEQRDRSSKTREREDSRYKASDSRRTHDSSTDPQYQRPPRASHDDPKAGKPNDAQAQPQQQQRVIVIDSDESGDDALQYVDVPEQPEKAEAQQMMAEISAGPPGRPSGLPPRPESNSQPPSIPPHPQSPRSGHYYSQNVGTKNPQQPPPQPGIGAPGRSSYGGFSMKLFGQSSDSRDRNREQYDRLYAEFQRSQDELKRAQNEIRRLFQNNRELDADRNRHKENASAISNELRNVQRELEDYRTLSEVRGKELVGAQVFLTKADQLSSSELSQKVNGLNEETFQAAAWLADSIHHAQYQWKSEEERQKAYEVTCMIVGEPATRLLVAHASEPEPNFYLVQLVMQVFFANFCSIKIERWYEGGSEVNNFLGALHGEIRRNEEQAVSGRWRAITHAHLRSSPDEWTRETTNKLTQIMEIASWQVPADKRSSFEQKLKPIFKAILDIRVALGEHFTSADIEIFCPAPGATFEPQNMEDALDDGRGKGKDTGTGAGSFGAILGTAGLGLREVASRGTRSGSDEYRTVLAPKVIPQVTLNEVLQPAPPKAKKSKHAPNAG